MDSSSPQVYWLHGLPDTGKSTVAKTFLSHLREYDGADVFYAGFFCSRQDQDRKNLKLIFPTLAVKLALTHPRFRHQLVQAIKSNSGVTDEPLINQLDKWIVRPLEQLNNQRTVIVIDGLDECEDNGLFQEFRHGLWNCATKISNIKFFITSRNAAGRLAQSGCAMEPPFKSEKDIRAFLKLRLRAYEASWRNVSQNDLGDWPAEETLDELCKYANGEYTAAVKIVQSFSRLWLRLRSTEAVDTLLDNLKKSAPVVPG